MNYIYIFFIVWKVKFELRLFKLNKVHKKCYRTKLNLYQQNDAESFNSLSNCIKTVMILILDIKDTENVRLLLHWNVAKCLNLVSIVSFKLQ